jgi:hypothetical protein
MLRSIYVVLAVAVLGGPVFAQPAAGSGSAAQPTSADRAELPVPPEPTPAPAPVMPSVPPPDPDSPEVQALKKACTDAMNADPAFGDKIVQLAATSSVTVEKLRALVKDYDIKQAHVEASAAIAKNERHVIMAYAAMWLLSVGFLIFMWRRQAGLRGQIAELKRDLEAALKDGK